MKTLSIVVIAAGVLGFTVATVQAQSVKATPATQRPEGSVTISGTSFGDVEAVDVYIDTVDTSLLVTSGTGTFTGAVTIPATAQPGAHYITAIGRHSGTAAQSKITVSTPWLQDAYGGAHLGWNPYENTLNTSNVTDLGWLWQAPLSNSGSGATPAVQAGRVFMSTNTGIDALSTTTGTLLWSKATSERFDAAPAVASGLVYAASYQGNLYALSATTGAQKWIFTLPTAANGDGFYSSPEVVGGVLYIASSQGNVYAVNAATGVVIWSVATGAEIDGTPTVAGGVLYIGARTGILYGLNPATGATLWQYSTGVDIESTPAFSAGTAYVGCDDGYLYAFKSTGALRWKVSTGSAIYAPPAVAHGQIFVSNQAGHVYALSADSGTVLWTVQTGTTIARGPVVANGVVYQVSDDTLYALSASTGAILRTSVTGTTYFGGPAVSDGVVYVDSYDGAATALSLLANTDVSRAGPPAISALRPNVTLKPSESGRAEVAESDSDD